MKNLCKIQHTNQWLRLPQVIHCRKTWKGNLKRRSYISGFFFLCVVEHTLRKTLKSTLVLNMNLVVPTEQLGAASVLTQMVTVFDKKVSRWSSSTRQWLPDVVCLHEESITSWTAHVQLYKTKKRKTASYFLQFQSPTLWLARMSHMLCPWYQHLYRRVTLLFQGGKKTFWKKGMHNIWTFEQCSRWVTEGSSSSGQGNTRLKPLHMTCWGFTEQVGVGRRTSWSPGASPEEAGTHVEAPLSHPVIAQSLFLILGYSEGAVHDCSSPKTM